MRRPISFVLLLTLLCALAGCGDSESASDATVTSTNAAVGAAATTPAAAAATTTPAPAPAAAGKDKDSSFVVVTSLLGRQLPKEPECRFAKTFVPDNPAPASYDGALALTVTCDKSEGYRSMGQIVNRAGSKPTQITCRDTTNGELYCVYVPSTSVGLYFTGTDRAVVRRRLEHLIEIVEPLPKGITPLSGASAR